MNKLYKLKKYLKGYELRLFVNLLLNACTAFFSIFSFIMLMPFLQLIFKSDEMLHIKYPTWQGVAALRQYVTEYMSVFIAEQIQTNGKLMTLAFICICTASIFFLKNLSRYFALYMLAPIKTGLSSSLREKLFNKLIFLDNLELNNQKKGDITAKITTDIQEIEYGILFFMEVLLREPITILITFFVMLVISLKLTFFVLIVLPLSGYIIARIGKKLKQTSAEAQVIQGKLHTIIDESINNHEAIQSYQSENYFIQLFTKLNRLHLQLNTFMLRRRDLSSPLAEFLGMAVVLVVLFVGGSMILSEQSDLKPELFIAYIVIFSQVIQPAKVFSNAFYFIQKGMASLERIEDLLSLENKISDHEQSVALHEIKTNIVFKDVSFKYHHHLVLKDINVHLSKGKKIAIVGSSGSGKSTFAKLLMRLYDVSNGEILIDNINIKNISINDLRSQIAWVSQHALMFDDSIENNILLGKPKDEKLFRIVCQQAQLDEFVLSKALQYDTKVGHNGNKLSGGERQRISLARAMYKNASLIILDEATAHLDAQNEEKIHNAIQQLPNDKTIIIISHNLNIIQYCNEIYTIKDGMLFKSK